MHPNLGIIRKDNIEMLKISFTKQELEKLMDVIHFTPMQKRIMQYRLDEESRVKMAELEK